MNDARCGLLPDSKGCMWAHVHPRTKVFHCGCCLQECTGSQKLASVMLCCSAGRASHCSKSTAAARVMTSVWLMQSKVDFRLVLITTRMVVIDFWHVMRFHQLLPVNHVSPFLYLKLNAHALENIVWMNLVWVITISFLILERLQNTFILAHIFENIVHGFPQRRIAVGGLDECQGCDTITVWLDKNIQMNNPGCSYWDPWLWWDHLQDKGHLKLWCPKTSRLQNPMDQCFWWRWKANFSYYSGVPPFEGRLPVVGIGLLWVSERGCLWLQALSWHLSSLAPFQLQPWLLVREGREALAVEGGLASIGIDNVFGSIARKNCLPGDNGWSEQSCYYIQVCIGH